MNDDASAVRAREIATHQALQRTNAKGEQGIFACTDCGEEGHLAAMVTAPCSSPRNITQGERLMRAIKGERDG